MRGRKHKGPHVGAHAGVHTQIHSHAVSSGIKLHGGISRHLQERFRGAFARSGEDENEFPQKRRTRP